MCKKNQNLHKNLFCYLSSINQVSNVGSERLGEIFIFCHCIVLSLRVIAIASLDIFNRMVTFPSTAETFLIPTERERRLEFLIARPLLRDRYNVFSYKTCPFLHDKCTCTDFILDLNISPISRYNPLSFFLIMITPFLSH